MRLSASQPGERDIYISKTCFRAGLSSLDQSEGDTEDWLETIGFDFDEDAVEVFGAFGEHEMLDDLIDSGELPWALDGSEHVSAERLTELDAGAAPNQSEIEAFKELWVQNLLESKEEGSVVFLGRVMMRMGKLERLFRSYIRFLGRWFSIEATEIWVFVKKTGNSFDGVEARFFAASIGNPECARKVFMHGVLVEDYLA